MLACGILLILAASCGSAGDRTCPALEPGRPMAPSSSCAECHSDIFETWVASHHAQAEIPLEPNTVFVQDQGPDGEVREFPAIRSIGVDPLQQYLIQIDGNLQVSQQAKDPRDGTWFSVFADGRQPGEWGHWTGRGMNWDTMCAICHNTGVERKWSMETDRFTTTVVEHGVGCNACHESGSSSIPTADSCYPCHSRRSELAPAPGPAPFFDHYSPALPDLSATFHVDGQILEEDFEYTSFAHSKMFAAGVTCLDCHDPHSSELRSPGDSLCMTCHSGAGRLPAPVIEPIAHGAHGDQTPLRCMDCHMPTTVYMQLDPRHDHGFHIPDPRLTSELGVPNACNRCHQDQTSQWATEIVEARPNWNGNGATRRRASALHAARTDAADALPKLLEAYDLETQPTWRASLLGVLQGWAREPAARERLQKAAQSDHPLIRSKALATPQLLEDPVRIVRLGAASQVGPSLDPRSTAGRDRLGEFHQNRGTVASALEEARLLIQQGSPKQIEQVALPLARMASKWEASLPDPTHVLASALDALGRKAEALEAMEECCERFPESAQSWFLLGLSAGASRDYVRCKQALEKALELRPDFPDAARNLQAILEFEASRKK